MPEKYFTEQWQFCRNSKDGVDVLTNFTAQITKEVIYHDGPKTETHITIKGEMAPELQPSDDMTANERFQLTNQELNPPRPLPEITIPAAEFDGMGWVAKRWGMVPIIFPVPNAERDIRTAIQLISKPTKEHVYTSTGWTTIEGKPSYVTNSGGIGAKGLDASISVQLPHELRNYKLPAPTGSKEAFLASIRLVNLSPNVIWPLLMCAYRACIRPSDFAVHLAGRTGTFKSEVTSLIQSHYGEQMDARNLPASWSSTANALEHLAYRAKDALFTMDDFVPNGTAWQVRQLQKSADQIIRAQGNQAGRSRLTDVTALQTTYYPRGLIQSTGEDVPEGHSIRGRMMILELTPGEIATAKLTEAQGKRPLYSLALADWIHWLAKNPQASADQKELAHIFRDENLGTGHTRTPPMIGELMATARLLSSYGLEMGWIAHVQANEIFGKAKKAILIAGEKQRDYLEAADPVVAFIETIRTMLASNIGHAKTKNGGIPEKPEIWGWTKQQTTGQLASYSSNGPTVGYLDTEAGEFLFDQGTIQFIKKYSGGRLAITNQTLVKRIAEAGLIVRKDEHRDRNTIRVNIDGHQRYMLALELSQFQPDQATD